MTFIPNCSQTTISQASGIDCEVITGQIVGMALYLRADDASFASISEIQAETNWNSNASSNGLIYTPQFGQGAIVPPSERNETGRDSNESIGGVGILNGNNTVTATAQFHGLDYATIETLRSYTQQSTFSRTRLLAYFIVEGRTGTSGRVMAATDGTAYSGIEIFNWRVGSKDLQGFNTKDMTNIDFVLKGDWDSNVALVDGLDFNPIDKLVAGTTASS